MKEGYKRCVIKLKREFGGDLSALRVQQVKVILDTVAALRPLLP